MQQGKKKKKNMKQTEKNILEPTMLSQVLKLYDKLSYCETYICSKAIMF